jgi:putative endonuclease
VYVLRNSKSVFYKGHTNDLEKRVLEHNTQDSVSYTKLRGPWTLVYQEKFKTRGEAMRREKFLKSGRGRLLLREVMHSAELRIDRASGSPYPNPALDKGN